MIDVLLVDDEYYIVERLKTIIAWESYGFKIAATASNGKEALEKFYQYHPQLVLIDINMNIMTGLDFCEVISQSPDQHDVQIIILSGYDDFSYAQQALRYGVSDYLLKPVEISLLLSALEKVKHKLIQTENLVKEYHHLASQNSKLYYKQRVNDLTTQHLSEDCVRDLLADHSLRLVNAPLTALVLTVEQNTVFSHDRKLWLFAIGNILEETLSPFPHLEISHDNYCHMTILVNAKNDDPILEKLCCDVIQHITENLPFSAFLSIGETVENLLCIYAAYQSALCGMKNKIAFENQSIIHANQVEKLSSYTSGLSDQFQQIKLLAKLGDSEGLMKIISGIFTSLQQNHSCYQTINLVLSSLACLEKELLDGKVCPESPPSQLGRSITEFDTYPDLQRRYLEEFSLAAQQILPLDKPQLNTVVIKVMHYIDQHFSEHDLSLRKIADCHFISHTYLSTIFKKETGLSVTEYITQIRMRNAKILMQGSSLSFKEISEQVGYSDSKYFSRCFRKAVGLSPTEFRR